MTIHGFMPRIISSGIRVVEAGGDERRGLFRDDGVERAAVGVHALREQHRPAVSKSPSARLISSTSVPAAVKAFSYAALSG